MCDICTSNKTIKKSKLRNFQILSCIYIHTFTWGHSYLHESHSSSHKTKLQSLSLSISLPRSLPRSFSLSISDIVKEDIDLINPERREIEKREREKKIDD